MTAVTGSVPTVSPPFSITPDSVDKSEPPVLLRLLPSDLVRVQVVMTTLAAAFTSSAAVSPAAR